VSGERHRAIAATLGFVEVALLQLQRRRVDLELHASGEAAQRIRDRQCFGERFFGRIVPAECDVGETEVVERDDDVIEQRVQAAVRECILEVAQRLAKSPRMLAIVPRLVITSTCRRGSVELVPRSSASWKSCSA
jgi:hypothetical protein